ncbi:MAG: hypothetical protein HG422_03960 [Prevotella sp.]|nr:hypothetical protein [Prevotella sp.]
MSTDVLENIKKAYSAVIEKNVVGDGMYAIAALICGILLINKFVTAYKEAYGGDAQRPINMKSFFTLFYTYFVCAGLLLAAAPVLNMIEELLADVQTYLMSQFQPPKDIDGEAMAAKLYEDFMNKVDEEDNLITAGLETFFCPVYVFIEMLIYYLTEYLYFIFAAGRYLYLALLKIVTPIAIVCSLSEHTRGITITYLKNLAVCYMLIPAYLIANFFAETLSKSIVGSWDTNTVNFDLISVCVAFVFKLSLFSAASKYTWKLLN